MQVEHGKKKITKTAMTSPLKKTFHCHVCCKAFIKPSLVWFKYWLKSCLSNYTLQLISHKALESCNYIKAIDLLKREFLDENLIINTIFNQILSYKP